jgi:hypothetical protein
MQPDADILKGHHHITKYSLEIEWTNDAKDTDYDAVYDGLVISEENIEAIVQRIRVSLAKSEPVIVAVFAPKLSGKSYRRGV